MDAHARTAQVTVTPKGEHFVVVASYDGGDARLPVARDNVVSETVKALERAGYGQREVRLTAPDWIKSELKARGYAF